MYVRKKPNRSGSISVVVIEKKNGKVHYLKTLGVSSDAAEIEDLYLQGKKWIVQQKGQRDMFLEHARKLEEKEVVSKLLNRVENILLNGTQLILNPRGCRIDEVRSYKMDYSCLLVFAFSHKIISLLKTISINLL